MPRIIRDGKAYDGTDAVITGLGQVWDEVVEINYTTNQEHQPNHTIGSEEATSWSKGKITHEASITLMMNQVSAIEKAAGGSLLKIKPFDLNISFLNEFNAIVNDTVTCKFMQQGRTVNTEMGLAQQYQLFTLGIEYNNA